MQDRFTEWFYNTLFDLNFLSTFWDFLGEKIGLFVFIYLALVCVHYVSIKYFKVKIEDLIKVNEDSQLKNDLNKELNKTQFNYSLAIYYLGVTICIMFVAYAATFSGAARILTF